METAQQNGRFTLFSSKFPSNIYSIFFVKSSLRCYVHQIPEGQVQENIVLQDQAYVTGSCTEETSRT